MQGFLCDRKFASASVHIPSPNCRLHFLTEKCPELLERGKVALDLLDLKTVGFVKSYQNIVVGFCQIVHDTINVRLAVNARDMETSILKLMSLPSAVRTIPLVAKVVDSASV